MSKEEAQRISVHSTASSTSDSIVGTDQTLPDSTGAPVVAPLEHMRSLSDTSRHDRGEGSATSGGPVDQTLRKERNRKRAIKRRERETSPERTRRRELERLRAAERRRNESPTEREIRREKGRLRAMRRRQNETEEERSRRREQNRIRMAERRRALKEEKLGTQTENQGSSQSNPHGTTSQNRATTATITTTTTTAAAAAAATVTTGSAGPVQSTANKGVAENLQQLHNKANHELETSAPVLDNSKIPADPAGRKSARSAKTPGQPPSGQQTNKKSASSSSKQPDINGQGLPPVQDAGTAPKAPKGKSKAGSKAKSKASKSKSKAKTMAEINGPTGDTNGNRSGSSSADRDSKESAGASGQEKFDKPKAAQESSARVSNQNAQPLLLHNKSQGNLTISAGITHQHQHQQHPQLLALSPLSNQPSSFSQPVSNKDGMRGIASLDGRFMNIGSLLSDTNISNQQLPADHLRDLRRNPIHLPPPVPQEPMNGATMAAPPKALLGDPNKLHPVGLSAGVPINGASPIGTSLTSIAGAVQSSNNLDAFFRQQQQQQQQRLAQHQDMHQFATRQHGNQILLPPMRHDQHPHQPMHQPMLRQLAAIQSQQQQQPRPQIGLVQHHPSVSQTIQNGIVARQQLHMPEMSMMFGTNLQAAAAAAAAAAAVDIPAPTLGQVNAVPAASSSAIPSLAASAVTSSASAAPFASTAALVVGSLTPFSQAGQAVSAHALQQQYSASMSGSRLTYISPGSVSVMPSQPLSALGTMPTMPMQQNILNQEPNPLNPQSSGTSQRVDYYLSR